MSRLTLTICGHVGKVTYNDVNGKKVCNFSVAHSRGKDEKKQTTWIEFAAWNGENGNGMASVCEAIELKTGDKVTVWAEWMEADAYIKDGAAIGKIKANMTHIEK